MIKNFSVKKVFQGRLFKGEEIVSGVNKFLKENSIKAGLINGIGAVRRSKIGYYDQSEKSISYMSLMNQWKYCL